MTPTALHREMLAALAQAGERIETTAAGANIPAQTLRHAAEGRWPIPKRHHGRFEAHARATLRGVYLSRYAAIVRAGRDPASDAALAEQALAFLRLFGEPVMPVREVA